LVIIWAFAGIAVKQAGAPIVSSAAWAVAALAAIVLIASLIARSRRGRPLVPAG
jgi:hypothetical protein